MTHAVSRAGAALGGCAALLSATVAQARTRPPEPRPSGRIQQLVATDGRLLAIRDGEILTFAPDGTRLSRCAGFSEAVARNVGPRPGAPDASEVLRDAGLPDDDSTLAAEDVLDDELGRRPARRARASPPGTSMVPHALAARGTSAWAATSDGVYVVDGPGCRRVALARRDLIAIAAGAVTLAAASADQLFVAELAEPDAGPDRWSFRPAAALRAPPHALAVDAAGAVLIADRGGVLRVGGNGEVRPVLDVAAEALWGCGDSVAALAPGGLYLWDGDRFRLAGPRPPAAVLACGDRPQQRWLAGGTGLWSSPDGARWAAHAQMLAATVAGIAVVAGRVWVATDAGLMPARLDVTAWQRPGPLPEAPAAPASRPPPQPPGWPWPAVTAAVSMETRTRSTTHRTLTAFLLFQFPLGRAPSRREASEPALERARREADLARQQLGAAGAAAAIADPLETDELAAWGELAAGEREALR